MERITKKEVFKLAEQLMLRLSDDEAENIIAEFDTLLKAVGLIKSNRYKSCRRDDLSF
jgi:Asp-tRNA(Asn)/Glu-tRNA(Gln) amidotransferase C subunit